MIKDITDFVERFELFEERLGVCLENLYVTFDGKHIRIKGELHVRDEGLELDRHIWLDAAAYDHAGRVVGTQAAFYNKDCFYGFEVFSIVIFLDPEIQLARVKLYPRVA